MGKKNKIKNEKDDIIDKLVDNIKNKKDTPEYKEYLKQLSKIIDDYKHKYDDARKYGKNIGKKLVEKFKATPIIVDNKTYYDKGLNTNEASEAISEILFQCYRKDQEGECRELLNKWTNDKLWGKIVIEYIPTLKEVWQYLHDNKYTKNNTLGFGDVDGAIWVEYPKQEETWPDERKIIIHTSYCSFADDNTHIFILDDSKFYSLNTLLHVRTVWPRQNSRGGYKVKKSKKYPKGWFSWKDDRDIKKPSLNTYRKRNFKYSYQDGRDEGYTLSLKNIGTPSIEWSNSHQGKIQHAIWLINQMKFITTDESYQCK